MSSWYLPCHPFPGLSLFLNLFSTIGIPPCASYVIGAFYSNLNQKQNSNKILAFIINNLMNLWSTNYHHYLSTFLIPYLVIGTSVHYHISCMILTPIRVHLHSHLLLHAWISSRAHLNFIVSWNVLLKPWMMTFLYMILVILLALLHLSLTCLTRSNAAFLSMIFQRRSSWT